MFDRFYADVAEIAAIKTEWRGQGKGKGLYDHLSLSVLSVVNFLRWQTGICSLSELKEVFKYQVEKANILLPGDGDKR